MIMDSIFDDVIEEITVKPPIAILKELALALEKKTKGLLIGRVEQNFFTHSSQFLLEFYITAPSLNNYEYKVFDVKHDLNFYPLTVNYPNYTNIKAENQEELEIMLKKIFSSSEVKRVVNGLLLQVKAA